MSAFGLRAFSGVTVGVVGSVIGIHLSLALSTIALFRHNSGTFCLRFSRNPQPDES
jgi:hypothetical protein